MSELFVNNTRSAFGLDLFCGGHHCVANVCSHDVGMSDAMNVSRRLLQHFLAALAYRTQKALRDAPDRFGAFSAGVNVRTPHQLLWHMTGVIGYARTMLHGGAFAPPGLPSLDDEIVRFHETLAALHDDFGNEGLIAQISDEQFLQGPLSDAMTHAGQLAMLRRMFGSPMPSENFIFAAVITDNVSSSQPAPVAPDAWWTPDRAPHAPGAGKAS